ncbi:MAG: winged helix-turn-helix transcriptional regulator [Phycisphaerales bacterium JB041]
MVKRHPNPHSDALSGDDEVGLAPDGDRDCPARVVHLAHRRWTIPLLAQLHLARVSGDSTGARSVGLTRRLGVGREALRQTVEFAIAHGWMVRNAGHGHPLRPDFVLTGSGRALAPACERVWRTAVLAGATEPLARKWTAPLLRVLEAGPARFGALKAALGPHGATDRAISQALRMLTEGGWIVRRVVRDYPPRVEYGIAGRCRALASAIARL